jgi:hypothetical protein
MKRIISIALVAGLGFFIGCSNKTPKKIQPACEIDGAKAPSWICDGGANMTGGIFAVGSAPKSPLGIGFQRSEAMAHARDELARELELKVKNMFKTYLSSTGVGDNQTAERVAQSVSKQISNKVLRGSRLLQTWISPKGTMYVLVGIRNNDELKKAIKQAAQTTFKNDEALWQEFKAKKAQEELDAAIEKELNGSQ